MNKIKSMEIYKQNNGNDHHHTWCAVASHAPCVEAFGFDCISLFLWLFRFDSSKLADWEVWCANDREIEINYIDHLATIDVYG